MLLTLGDPQIPNKHAEGTNTLSYDLGRFRAAEVCRHCIGFHTTASIGVCQTTSRT